MSSSSTLPFSPFPILSKPNPNKSSQFFNHRFNTINKYTTLLKLNNNNNINKNHNANLSISCYTTTVGTTTTTASNNRLQTLVSEFESLTEPIERVKRLLEYAGELPPFDESGRLPGNRVVGCTTQVWVEARIDEKGRMRFRGDSDSEISKGFISCLIWLLDGLEPEEVVSIQAEDLAAINVVGIYATKAHSRINTWNNVLITMQNRTRALVAQLNTKSPLQLISTANATSFPQSQMDSLSAILEVCH